MTTPPTVDVIHIQNKFHTHFVHRSRAGWWWCGRYRLHIEEVTIAEIEIIVKMSNLKMLEIHKAQPVW